MNEECERKLKELRDHYGTLIHGGYATQKDYRKERRALLREFRKDKFTEGFKLWKARKQNTIYTRKRDRKAKDKINMEKIKPLDKFGGIDNE